MAARTVLLASLLVAAGVVGAVAVGSSAAPAADRPAPDRLISPGSTESYLWPHTSRSRSVGGRTLPLNVLVHGEHDRVRRIFVGRSDADWAAFDRNESLRISPWRPAHGSVRYTYVTESPNALGRWTPPAYQLAVGTYFGERTHIRAYPGLSGEWTALQAHTEYWDWFRVRHTVTGVASGARFVENDLRGERSVESVSRTERDVDEGGARWSVVDLAPAALIAVLAVPLATRRLRPNRLLFPAALAAAVLGVRVWGLAAEAAFPALNPKLVVATGYPLLALGPPALVAAFARERSAATSAVAAAVGLGVGIVVDTAAVGVRWIPPELALHRALLLAALGTLAVGVANDDGRVLAAGAFGWVALLAAPLFGVV